MRSKVSIVIPAGSSPTGLLNTIESCRFQSHRNLEIIVTAGNRDVENLVYGLNDSRIRILATTLDSESQRLATALKYVKGDYATFLMPGDSQEYNRIERQLGYDISLCNIHYVDEPAKRINEKYLLYESLDQKRKDYLVTLMVDTELLLNIGIFNGDSQYPIQEWLSHYFDEYGGKIPILKSRLYRKEKYDNEESTTD